MKKGNVIEIAPYLHPILLEEVPRPTPSDPSTPESISPELEAAIQALVKRMRDLGPQC